MSDTRGVNQQGEMGDAFEVARLAAAAHELKSPLALMRQIAMTLESDEIAPAERFELASRIRLTSERSLQLVQDLALAGRSDLPSLFELEPLNPIALCQDVAHDLAPLYHAHGKQLEVRSYRRPPLVVGNRRLLHSVLVQFADNALRYAEADEPVYLTMRSVDDGRRVEVGVRDYGPALSVDLWERLTAVGQTPQPIVRRPESSGLGLTIARQFANAMNGHVGVTRHRDGASFYVSLAGSTQLSWV